MMNLDSRIPDGPLQDKWDSRKFELKLVNPANKRKYKVIVVGSGLAGASAAASLAELGYQVECFCFQDSPRRAHSIAAQGGINAAKNYRNDGDSVWRLFYDTVKGGDFRAREANVYRLAQCSVNIIDQAVAQGVPFARDYSGLLDNRSFGGAQVSRTFYARGQTGQQQQNGRQLPHGREGKLNPAACHVAAVAHPRVHPQGCPKRRSGAAGGASPTPRRSTGGAPRRLGRERLALGPGGHTLHRMGATAGRSSSPPASPTGRQPLRRVRPTGHANR